MQKSVESNQGHDSVEQNISTRSETRKKSKQAKHIRQGEINKVGAADKWRLEGRLPLGSPQVCLLIMLLVWLRGFDKGSDSLLKVAASDEPQNKQRWKTPREAVNHQPGTYKGTSLIFHLFTGFSCMDCSRDKCLHEYSLSCNSITGVG